MPMACVIIRTATTIVLFIEYIEMVLMSREIWTKEVE